MGIEPFIITILCDGRVLAKSFKSIQLSNDRDCKIQPNSTSSTMTTEIDLCSPTAHGTSETIMASCRLVVAILATSPLFDNVVGGVTEIVTLLLLLSDLSVIKEGG